jgi:hypothetical protein
MAARFTKPKGGKAVPVIPEVQPAYGASQIGISNQPKPKMDMLDKGSAAIWNVLSAIGGQLKYETNALKNDPVGSLKSTLDAYTVGPEARQRWSQGDYGGAITHSGLGSLMATDSMDNILRGKGSPSDALWIALTYGTGGLGKAATAAKSGTKAATMKAYIDVLNRLK